MFKTNKSIAMLAIVFNLMGCASMFGDNTRKITVKSNPSGAGVYVDGVRYGTTPTIITLNNYIYGGKVITLRKDGYKDQAEVVNTKFQPVGLWNILNWPVGFIVDAVTGDIIKVDPENLNIDANLQTDR
ncbi:MAG TPA: PEGA domain-containing protein [Burkholderiales bacterium]|nr:PEGA domain-containing protein [Burkholderiales bacterium]